MPSHVILKIEAHTRQGIKNEPSKTCRRQPLRSLIDMVCLGRPGDFKFFKGCLPQILLGQFLNALTRMLLILKSVFQR